MLVLMLCEGWEVVCCHFVLILKLLQQRKTLSARAVPMLEAEVRLVSKFVAVSTQLMPTG